MFKVTGFSGALLRSGRATFGTIVQTDGGYAFAILATRTVVPIIEEDAFSSRANVTGAAIRRGSALLTGSSVSVNALALDQKRTYPTIADFVRYSTVGRDVPEDAKADIIAGLASFYGEVVGA